MYLCQHRSGRFSCHTRYTFQGGDPERSDIPLCCTVSPKIFDMHGLLLVLSLLLRQRSFGCLCGQYNSDTSTPALSNRALAETCAVYGHCLKQYVQSSASKENTLDIQPVRMVPRRDLPPVPFAPPIKPFHESCLPEPWRCVLQLLLCSPGWWFCVVDAYFLLVAVGDLVCLARWSGERESSNDL